MIFILGMFIGALITYILIDEIEEYKFNKMMDEIPLDEKKKEKEKMLTGEIKPVVKPDVDNVAKSILDSLNGIIYLDDKQIIELDIEKLYEKTSWTKVKIVEI